MKRIKKRYYFIFTITLIIFLVLFFASTIIKNYVVKHSEELIGRKIDIKELHINYFKVAVGIKGFTLFEADKETPFVSFSEVYINLDPTKLYRSELAFSQIRIVDLYAEVVQNDTIYNFSDIIDFFTKKSVNETPAPKDSIQEPMKYSVSNFELVNGYFHYKDKKLNTKIDLKKMGLKLPYIAWDSKNADMGVEFNIDEGEIAIKSQINPVTRNYQFKIKSRKLALAPFTPYLKDFMKISSFEGQLHTDIVIDGNYEEVSNIRVSGEVGVSNFSMKDENKKEFLAANSVTTQLDSIDLKNSYYHIQSVNIEEPYIFAELFKNETNFDKIFAPVLKAPTPAKSKHVVVKKGESKNKMVYLVDSILISDGNLQFVDNTLNRKFIYNVSDINFDIGHISETSRNMPAKFDFVLNKSGHLNGSAVLDMVQSLNLKANFSFSNVDMISFSPYTEYYVGRPVTEGRFNYKCDVKMSPKSLKNDNIILVKQINFGKKINNNPQIKAPVMLGLYLLKDPRGNVDMNVPVTGNPSDPKFNYWSILWKTLGNVLIKVAASPFNLLGQAVGISSDPEEMKKVNYAITQDSITNDVKEKLDKIVELKSKKPQLTFLFTQVTNEAKEKEKLAIDATKRDMILAKSDFIDETLLSKKIQSTSESDSLFVKYIGTRIPEGLSMTLQEACIRIQGEQKLNTMFYVLLAKRNTMITNYLVSKGIPASEFRVLNGDMANLPEEQKTPKHMIEISFK